MTRKRPDCWSLDARLSAITSTSFLPTPFVSKLVPGLPAEIPELVPAEFEALWGALGAAFGISGVAFAEHIDEESVVRCMDEIFFPCWDKLSLKLGLNS